jgi:hypothetical protein
MIVLAYQRVDARCDGKSAPLEQRVRAQALLGPAVYFAIVAFGLAISASIGELALFWSSLFVHLPVVAWILARMFDARQQAIPAEIAETNADLPLRPL